MKCLISEMPSWQASGLPCCFAEYKIAEWAVKFSSVLIAEQRIRQTFGELLGAVGQDTVETFLSHVCWFTMFFLACSVARSLVLRLGRVYLC